jgi:predicted AAA+ superfamily ATPase
LPPWFYNTKKRLVKRPKIYFRDSGLFHSFNSVENYAELQNHPKLGASWEGFAIEQFIRLLDLKDDQVFFWAVHTGAELDLLFQKKGEMWGAEFKYTDAPKITPSLKSAIEELDLSHVWIIFPGKNGYPLSEKVTVVGLNELLKIRENLFNR